MTKFFAIRFLHQELHYPINKLRILKLSSIFETFIAVNLNPFLCLMFFVNDLKPKKHELKIKKNPLNRGDRQYENLNFREQSESCEKVKQKLEVFHNSSEVFHNLQK